MLAWMAYATLAAAALGLTAWLIDFAVAGRVERRRVLWAVVFFASAVGPIVFSVTRGSSTPVVAEGHIGDAAAAQPIVSDRVLASAWLAASAIFALSLLATQRRLRRRLRGCASRTVDGEQVLVSSDFGPAVVGVVRPEIVLPAWALAMRETDRRVIVAHETEHRQAHDPLLAAVALIVAVALPWNAALWWQLRRLRLAIEIDCDRRVVSRHGHDPHSYGMLLLATRERASRATPVMAMAMAAMRSGLGRRVEALVDGRPRAAVRRLSALVAAVVLTAGIVSIPAPRLSIVHAAVIDTPAAAPAPLASAAMPSPQQAPTQAAPPAPPKKVSTPKAVSRSRPRQPAAVPPSDSATVASATEPIVRVIGSSVRVILPPGARPSSPNRQSLRVIAPNRAVLLPIRDSLPTSSP